MENTLTLTIRIGRMIFLRLDNLLVFSQDYAISILIGIIRRSMVRSLIGNG